MSLLFDEGSTFLSIMNNRQHSLTEIASNSDINASQNIVFLLKSRLDSHRHLLRPHQIRSIEKLIAAFERGVFQGLIKQPTGAGKTRLFGEIIHALHLPTLVLVPRSALLQQTKFELEESGYKKEEIQSIAVASGKNATKLVQKNVEEMRAAENGNVVVMTYQSFLSISSNKGLFKDLLAQMKVVISDEAHRSIGQRTTEVLSELDQTPEKSIFQTRRATVKALKNRTAPRVSDEESTEEVIDVLDDLDSEERQEVLEIHEEEGQEYVVEKIIRQQASTIHLRLTATPRLAEKDVQSVYGLEVIDWVRIQELVEDGTLILPQLVDVGTATYLIGDDESKPIINDHFLTAAADSGKFWMADGRSVTEAVLQKILEKKAEQPNRYLPTVVFCSTVEQAEQFKIYAISQGVSAVRCTSSNDTYDMGTVPDQAKQQLESGTIDMVVTVSKVGEGWDVPTLRCAAWLRPTNSPALSLQGNGRIMRSLPADSPLPPKGSHNTFIIEPRWQIVRKPEPEDEGEGGPEDHAVESDTKPKKRPKKKLVYAASNFLERLIELDEMDYESLERLGITIERKETIDFKSDDHLRLLIGSVGALIADRKWVNLQKKCFSCPEKGWDVSGRQIGNARFKKWGAGSAEAEALARHLWPTEAVELILDMKNDDHLRLLIGSVGALIVDGKGVSLITKRFSCLEKGWDVSGGQIGNARFGKQLPGSSEAEALARQLWPAEAAELLPKEKIDLMNDDHLRLLIGSVGALIVDGKGVCLLKKRFCCPEKGWDISGGQIGNTRFGKQLPGSSEAEALARQLWPAEAAELLPKEKIDLMNDDHLRLLIGSVGALIVDGKGVGLERKRFSCDEKKWIVSGGQIGLSRLKNRAPGSAGAEELARQLWPKEAAELLSNEKIDLSNDDHLRVLIGSIDALIEHGKGVCLQKIQFTCDEKKWVVSGGQIGHSRFKNKSPGSAGAEELARQLWQKEAAELLPKEKIDLKNDDHLRLLIGSIDALIEHGKGVSLVKKRFSCPEKYWDVSGSQIGNARFGKKNPGSSEAETLARQLWPAEAAELIPKEKIDLMNDDNLRI
jgi:superfamily II DNA or RNA helicase